MIVIDIAIYLLVGLTVAILVPWACLETAEFFSGMRERSLPHQGGHWIVAAAFLAATALAGCGGGAKDGAGTIVSPKAPSGSGAAKTEGESILPGGGSSGAGPDVTGDAGEGSPPALGEGATVGTTGGTAAAGGAEDAESGTSPALIMQVVNTILN